MNWRQASSRLSADWGSNWMSIEKFARLSAARERQNSAAIPIIRTRTLQDFMLASCLTEAPLSISRFGKSCYLSPIQDSQVFRVRNEHQIHSSSATIQEDRIGKTPRTAKAFGFYLGISHRPGKALTAAKRLLQVAGETLNPQAKGRAVGLIKRDSRRLNNDPTSRRCLTGWRHGSKQEPLLLTPCTPGRAF